MREIKVVAAEQRPFIQFIGWSAVIIVGLVGCGPTTATPVTEAATGTAEKPSSTTTAASPGLPPMKHFQIGDKTYGAVHDCYVDDGAVTCTLSMEPSDRIELYEGTVTGTLSGFTLTGKQTTHQRYPDESDRSCIWTTDTSDPIIYVFSLDGTVAIRGGPGETHSTRSGSCTGSESSKGGPWESSDKWSVIE